MTHRNTRSPTAISASCGLVALLAFAAPLAAQQAPAAQLGVPRRNGLGRAYAGRAWRQDHPGHHAGDRRAGLAARGGGRQGSAHRGVRSRRGDRPRGQVAEDPRALPDHRRTDRPATGHHPDPWRHRPQRARRHHPAHPRARGRGRTAEDGRHRFRLDQHRRCLQRDRRPLLADLVHRREPVARPAPASRATPRSSGAKAPRTASPSATTSSPKAWATPRTPRASIRRAR